MCDTLTASPRPAACAASRASRRDRPPSASCRGPASAHGPRRARRRSAATAAGRAGSGRRVPEDRRQVRSLHAAGGGADRRRAARRPATGGSGRVPARRSHADTVGRGRPAPRRPAAASRPAPRTAGSVGPPAQRDGDRDVAAAWSAVRRVRRQPLVSGRRAEPPSPRRHRRRPTRRRRSRASPDPRRRVVERDRGAPAIGARAPARNAHTRRSVGQPAVARREREPGLGQGRAARRTTADRQPQVRRSSSQPRRARRRPRRRRPRRPRPCRSPGAPGRSGSRPGR